MNRMWCYLAASMLLYCQTGKQRSCASRNKQKSHCCSASISGGETTIEAEKRQ
jgi:hypothetical protein